MQPRAMFPTECEPHARTSDREERDTLGPLLCLLLSAIALAIMLTS